MSVLGSLVLALGPLGGNLKLFAVLYTIGNTMSIGRWAMSILVLIQLKYNFYLLQHLVPDGSHEAADQHVRQDQGDCHGGHVGCLGPHPLLCILVEEECPGPHVRNHPVLRHDLVLHFLYPLRQGCRHQVL